VKYENPGYVSGRFDFTHSQANLKVPPGALIGYRMLIVAVE